MSIPTTTDPTRDMTADEMRRHKKIGKLLTGMQPDRAVALLMVSVTAVIEYAQMPEIWEAIRSGAVEEMRLIKERTR